MGVLPSLCQLEWLGFDASNHTIKSYVDLKVDSSASNVCFVFLFCSSFFFGHLRGSVKKVFEHYNGVLGVRFWSSIWAYQNLQGIGVYHFCCS